MITIVTLLVVVISTRILALDQIPQVKYLSNVFYINAILKWLFKYNHMKSTYWLGSTLGRLPFVEV